VLQRSDITQHGQATVEEFRGTPSLAAAGRPELEARRSNG
jgi:hypothetical protein